MVKVAIGETPLLAFARLVGPPAAAAAAAAAAAVTSPAKAAAAAAAAAASATAPHCPRCRLLEAEQILEAWDAQQQQQQQPQQQQLLLQQQQRPWKPLSAPSCGLLLQHVSLLPGLEERLFPAQQGPSSAHAAEGLTREGL
ncbi:hypothetical protein Efla_003018 [Eimeria flavescens]